jgi:hypothetical protein
MKVREVFEMTAENYNEEQELLGAFPDAIWIKLDENRTKFYIKKDQEKEVRNFLVEKRYW